VNRLAPARSGGRVRHGRRVAAAFYRIVVGGRLGRRDRAEFEGLEVEVGDDESVLTGRIVDQAQLQGLLDRIEALHLVLVSVNRLDEPSGGPTGARFTAA
jgi:hypothetical protein